MLEPELYCWVSVYMTINDLNPYYPCSIYYYSCGQIFLIWLNVKSGLKPILALRESPVFLHTLFSLLALCLVCLLGHRLSRLWVALLLCVFSGQGLVNVGLFNHPYALIHLPFTCPSTQKVFPPIESDLAQVKSTWNTPLLLHLSVWQAFFFFFFPPQLMLSGLFCEGKAGETMLSWTPPREYLWFHGVDYFSS